MGLVRHPNNLKEYLLRTIGDLQQMRWYISIQTHAVDFLGWISFGHGTYQLCTVSTVFTIYLMHTNCSTSLYTKRRCGATGYSTQYIQRCIFTLYSCCAASLVPRLRLAVLHKHPKAAGNAGIKKLLYLWGIEVSQIHTCKNHMHCQRS